MHQRAAGLARAQSVMNLAVCFNLGLGTSKSLSRAVALFENAAEMGWQGALGNLSACCGKALGARSEYSQAAALCERAVTREDSGSDL